jgi:hypothetical protein
VKVEGRMLSSCQATGDGDNLLVLRHIIRTGRLRSFTRALPVTTSITQVEEYCKPLVLSRISASNAKPISILRPELVRVPSPGNSTDFRKSPPINQWVIVLIPGRGPKAFLSNSPVDRLARN